MAYRYIALLDTTAAPQAAHAVEATDRLNRLRMRQCLRTRHCTVHVSEQTPFIALHGQGLLIGHVFSRSGEPLTQEGQFPRFQSSSQLCRYILENCWGAYLVVLPDPEHDGRITLLRDPEGGMPCIHHLENGSGFIASDIELPLCAGRYQKRIDWDSILHRLIHPDIKTARTGLAGIQELLPGTRLVVHGTRLTLHTAWSPWDFLTGKLRHASIEDAAEAVRTAIDMVVNAWARTDRSILLELSGGLDSSVVGAALLGSDARVFCCTLTTPVPGADERHYANQIAALLDAPIDVETMGLESTLHDSAPAAGLPTPRVGMLQHITDTIMENARQRHGAASFFSGGGGDTVFCYLTSAAPAADAFQQMGLAGAFHTLRDLAGLHQCTIWKAGRLTLRKLMRPPGSPCNAMIEFISPGLANCLLEHHPWCDMPDTASPGDRERVFALAATHVYRDSAPRGRQAHLRLPLLSQPVMEATLRVPSWMWIAGARNRAVARQAFADRLPPEILARRSKGSFIGFVGALYARHRSRLRDYLLDGCLHSQGLLDAPAVQRFIDSDLPPRDRTFGRLLDLYAVENWIRHQT